MSHDPPTPQQATPHPGLEPGWFARQGWNQAGREYVPVDETHLAELMRWRNDQQSVLRQQEPLTPVDQERWFRDVVQPSYQQTHPRALQVVSKDGGVPVAYGGLTNIEWTSRRAELSFLVATESVEPDDRYAEEFHRFLAWTTMFAFESLGLHRLFTETWDFRDNHIEVLESCGFVLEGRMRDHVAKDGQFHDALLHGLLADDRRTS